MLMAELTWKEFAKALKVANVIILPIGPIEQHGPHLPLGADFIQPYEVAKKVSAKVKKVFVAPPLCVGSCKSTADFLGTIPVNPKTLRLIIRDFCIGFAKHGVKCIIIFNGHSGSLHIPAVDQGVRDALEVFPKLKIASVTFSSLCRKIIHKVVETENDVHAGEAETSRVLYLRPDLVKRNKMVCEHPKFPEHEVLEPCDYRKYMKTGVIGDATKATEEKGRKLVDEAVKELVRLAKDLSRIGKRQPP